MYQEEPGSTFTHDGQQYDLNYLLDSMEPFSVVQMPVDALSWVLEFDKPKVRRMLAADITTPVLVTWWLTEPEDKLVVVDGLHRLAKAMLLGETTIPARCIPHTILNMAKIAK